MLIDDLIDSFLPEKLTRQEIRKRLVEAGDVAISRRTGTKAAKAMKLNLKVSRVNSKHVYVSCFFNGAHNGKLIFNHAEYEMLHEALHCGAISMHDQLTLEFDDGLFWDYVKDHF